MEALNKILIIKGILAEKAGLDPKLYSELEVQFEELQQLLNKPACCALLPSIEVDLFENVECNVYGEQKLMHEYRILVEPDSQEHKFIEGMLARQ